MYYTIISVICITICFKSTVLFALNNWIDTNAYLTMGRAILNGMIPYKDLFDHKGPAVHYLYCFAAIISEKSYKGLYFLEIISCLIYLILSVKTSRLLFPKINSSFFVPLLLLTSYSTMAFHFDGSVE